VNDEAPPRPEPRTDPRVLPAPVRHRAGVALVLAGMVMFGACGELLGDSGKGQYREVGNLYAEPFKSAVLAYGEAYAASLEGMRGLRTASALALLVVGVLTFGAAVSLLRPPQLAPPDGLQRQGPRATLGYAALAMSALQAISGALDTVLAQRAGHAAAAVMAKAPEMASLPPQLFEWVTTGSAIAGTALMGGAFLWLSTYFRSEKVEQIVALQDRR
jgi:hypothetical protein